MNTCMGCKYYFACGDSTRAESCNGREEYNATKEHTLKVINEYLSREFNFIMLGNELPEIIELAYTTTENGRHEVSVKFNTKAKQWENYVDGELVSIEPRKSLNEFCDELESCDFDMIISDILYEAQQMENEEIREQRTVREKRITLLKAMHTIMLNMNNEQAYYTWVMCMPDEPTEDDFVSTADDDDFFDAAKETFEYIMKEYIKDGLFVGGDY